MASIVFERAGPPAREPRLVVESATRPALASPIRSGVGHEPERPSDLVSADPHRTTDRLAAGFVLTLMAIGCLALWIGVPLAGMWLAGELTNSFAWHMPLALLLVVSGMMATAIGLAWLNQLYLRITGGEIVRSGEFNVRRRGPVEPLLVGSLILAIIALFIWFFAFAENPSRGVWG
jgi:hypothetical protein